MKKNVRLLVITLAIIFAIVFPVSAETQITIDDLLINIQAITGYQPKYEIDDSTLTIYWPNATLSCHNAIINRENCIQIKPEINSAILISASKNKYTWYEKDSYIFLEGNGQFLLDGQENLKFEANYYEDYDILCIIYEGSLILVEPDSYSKDSNGFMVPIEHFAQAVYNWDYYLTTTNYY